MAQVDLEILTQFADAITKEIKFNIDAAGHNVSGETKEGVRSEVIPNRLQIIVPAQVITLEEGRGPTGAGAVSGEESLVDRLKRWIALKGLEINPFAVATKIHKEGTVLFRTGGKENIYSNVITDQRLQALFSILAVNRAGILKDELVKAYEVSTV